MGLFSGLGRIFNPDSIAMSQALLAGDYGAVGQLGARRQQLELQRQEAARQQQAADLAQQRDVTRQESLSHLGYSKDQINALNANDSSQLVREFYTPRQYGPQGGSTAYRAADGSLSYEQAPWRDQVGRSIVGADAGGQNQRVIFRGAEAVPVPNVGIYGSTSDQGIYDSGSPPTLGFLPQPSQSAPSLSASPPPQADSAAAPQPTGPQVADTRPQGMEAPALNANPNDLSGMPPVTSYRGVEFGSPLAGGPPRNMPRAGRAPRVPRGIVTVNSPEQAARLPRGTRFRTPDGRVIVRQ